MPTGRIYAHTLTLLATLAGYGCGGGDGDGGNADVDTPPSYEWSELIDGPGLAGWRRLDFDGTGGEVEIAEGTLRLGRGEPFSGVVIDDPEFTPPSEEYEIVVRARKLDGRDFFCALTFPVPEKGAHCTFVAGGWGGGVTGLSNIDHLDANRNSTRAVLFYETGRWYELRVELRRGQIRCWVDERLVAKALIADKHISLRPGPVEACAPLGLASYETAAEFSSLRVRALPPENR